MPFVPVPNTAKFSVVFDRGTEAMVNVFHFDRTGTWGLSELTSGAQTVLDWARTSLMPLLHNHVILNRVEARGLRAQEDVTVVVRPATAVTGGRALDLTPGNVAFAVTHVTGFTGRSARGRTFFGGLSEQDVVGDRIVIGHANALTATLITLLNVMLSSNWRMVVVSYRTNRQARTQGFVYPIQSFKYTDTILDSQRRRLPGRGR